jgi:molybdopterin converting factor small subunit
VIACTIELFGVARLVGHTREVPLELEADATLGHAFAALVRRVPALAGKVIAVDGMSLADGYACSRNGLEFVRNPAARVNAGDIIAILSADAGG